MKNVIILGASGIIAKHVIDILVKKDDVHLDNAQTKPRLISYLYGHSDAVYSVAFSPDGCSGATGLA